MGGGPLEEAMWNIADTCTIASQNLGEDFQTNAQRISRRSCFVYTLGTVYAAHLKTFACACKATPSAVRARLLLKKTRELQVLYICERQAG